MKLRTEFVYLAPDAERYVTIDDNEYDGAEDASPQLVGRGATEEESRKDFFDQWLERESERDCKRAVAYMKVWDGFLDKLFGRGNAT